MKRTRKSLSAVLRWAVGTALASLIMGMVAVSVPAQASEVHPLSVAQPANSAPYAYLLDYNSHKCLEVPAFSTRAGTQLDQWSCNGGQNQLWRLYSLGNAGKDYLFINEYSRQCVNVSGYGRSNGTAIIQWPCSPSSYASNEEFFANLFIGNLGGLSYYEYANEGTGLCLNVSQPNTSNGVKIIGWSCIPTGKSEWLASPYGP